MGLLDLMGTFQIFETPAWPEPALVQSLATSGLVSKVSTLFHWSLPYALTFPGADPDDEETALGKGCRAEQCPREAPSARLLVGHR